ncbi:hypothetical protein TIFTF001_005356 [Ficus carica]|uniref:Uncharacterized protein n=1 Tax=Ficus carica TaxID=3494 RepID=A0AA87ZLV1_FICCA|nr:hypothetical protein TIFTF001_005356 [Ficus carica]
MEKSRHEPVKRIGLLFPKKRSELLKFPEKRRIREEKEEEEEEKFGGKNSGENKERKKETGFLGIRMLELNRHLGIGEGGRGGDGVESSSTERESDSGIRIKELPMGLQQLGNANAAGAENI